MTSQNSVNAKRHSKGFSQYKAGNTQKGLHEHLQCFLKVLGKSTFFFYLADSILRAWNSSGPNIIPWEDWIWNASEKKLRRVYLFYVQLIITDLVSTVQAYKVFPYTAVALWLSCRCPCPWYSVNHPRGHYMQWLCLQVAHPTTELLHQDWKDLHYSSVGQTLALLTWISE